MAVTTNQVINRKNVERGSCPVAAATTLYEGTIAFINSSGYAVGTTGNGSNLLGGVVVREVDNSAGAAGDEHVEYYRQGRFLLTGSGFAQTDVDKPAYVTDNYTATPTQTDNAIYFGTITEYVSATQVWAEIDTKDQRIGYLSESFVVGDFTDNADATGYVDFTGSIPVGAIVLGWKAVTATGFTGDTTAVAQVGVAGTLDRFSSITTNSVFAAGTVGAQPADDASAFCAAETTPRVTVTGGSDFGSVAAGATTVTLAYLKI